VARSPAEIQAEIRLTRRAIDARLDAVDGRVPYRRWAPYGLLVGAGIVGLGLSRLPILRVIRMVGASAATVLTALHTYDTVRNRLVRPAADGPRPSAPGTGPSSSGVRGSRALAE
jgi:hypothetical protein